MRHQSSLPRNKYEWKINYDLIKVASVLQFHAKLYRYSKPCIDAQSSCFGVHELKRPPIICSLKLDHYRIFDTFNIRWPLKVPPSHWIFEVNFFSYGAVSSVLGNFKIETFSSASVTLFPPWGASGVTTLRKQ